MHNALIGYTGLIGKILLPQYAFTHFYNKNNIIDIKNTEFDTVICAAPSSNRIAVNSNPIDDMEMVLFLIDHLRKVKIKQFILIGTIDAVAAPNTRYGLNRKVLEHWVKNNIEQHHIIRLPILIHKNITKNILYDLKNKKYLDSINPKNQFQYYDLNNLITDIDYVVNNNIKEINLVSEPLCTEYIIENFFPELITTKFNSNTAVQTYNVTPYWSTKQDILNSMAEYFK